LKGIMQSALNSMATTISLLLELNEKQVEIMSLEPSCSVAWPVMYKNESFFFVTVRLGNVLVRAGVTERVESMLICRETKRL